jgi:hypothetical protein
VDHLPRFRTHIESGLVTLPLSGLSPLPLGIY